MLDRLYTYKATVLRVIDGDTLEARVDLGFTVSVRISLRLDGINTPETFGVAKDSVEYAAGMKAKDFTVNWLQACGSEVLITTRKATEKYGRWLAQVYNANGENLNASLIEQGLAKPYHGEKR